MSLSNAGCFHFTAGRHPLVIGRLVCAREVALELLPPSKEHHNARAGNCGPNNPPFLVRLAGNGADYSSHS
jgi:hypothetical protein